MSDDALEQLADPPPNYGGNVVLTELEERLFVGPTYVYRGEYPRRDPKMRDHAVEKVRRAGGDEPSPTAKPITGLRLDEEGAENAQRPTSNVQRRSEEGKSYGGLGKARFKYRKKSPHRICGV
jgi:hypothetical protein